jgi:hypothetical protein
MSKTTTSSRTDKTLRPMSAEEVEKAAWSDPDAQPLTPADLGRTKGVPQVKVIRRALELTQGGLRLAIIFLWVRCGLGAGRAEPDQPTRAYLTSSPK